MTAYVETHMLHTLPTSLINRDDTGLPKTTVHGGFTRSRWSSQSRKRQMRILFKDAQLLDDEHLSVRTRKISGLIAGELRGLGLDDADADALAVNLLWGAGLLNTDADNAQARLANVLLFLARSEITAIAERLYEGRTELLAAAEPIDKVFPADLEGVKTSKAERKANCPEVFKQYGKGLLKSLDARRSADIALFGRMLAQQPSANVGAAANVAHSFSVNEYQQIADYYTAVDDLVSAQAGETGSGFMGTAMLDAPTLYHYSCLDVDQLTANLDGDDNLVQQTIRAWLHANVFAQPHAKRTSTAPATRPVLVVVTIRHDQPLSLANAFLKPVIPGRDLDIEHRAARALAKHWKAIGDMYGHDGRTKAYHCWMGDPDVFDATAPLPGESLPAVAALIDSCAAMGLIRGQQ